MPSEVTMRFWREDYDGPASIEYSWVPEGVRHLITLHPGQQDETRTHPMPDGITPTHVRVYCLDNNRRLSTAMWQFPPGPPPSSGAAVASAVIEVFDERYEAIGTVFYDDATEPRDHRTLDRKGRQCPDGTTPAE